MRRSRCHNEVRHAALPRLWLMSDARIEDDLWQIIAHLPPGSGIILRDYHAPRHVRQARARRVAAFARRQGLIWLWSGSAREARALGADGVHAGRGQSLPRRAEARALVRSAPVHNLRALRQAERRGADMVLLSPVFPTASHPDARALGRFRAAALASATCLPVIALGGMTPQRARRMQALGLSGWAAISALSKNLPKPV